MTDEKQPVRFHVVRYTLTLIHEMPVSAESASGSEDFYYTEHNCFGNVVNDLHAAHEVDDEYSVCNICAAKQAEYMGVFHTYDEAVESGWSHTPKTTPYGLNVERKRARMKEELGE